MSLVLCIFLLSLFSKILIKKYFSSSKFKSTYPVNNGEIVELYSTGAWLCSYLRLACYSPCIARVFWSAKVWTYICSFLSYFCSMLSSDWIFLICSLSYNLIFSSISIYLCWSSSSLYSWSFLTLISFNLYRLLCLYASNFFFYWAILSSLPSNYLSSLSFVLMVYSICMSYFFAATYSAARFLAAAYSAARCWVYATFWLFNIACNLAS